MPVQQHRAVPCPPISRSWEKNFGDTRVNNFFQQRNFADWGYPKFAKISEIYPDYVTQDGEVKIKLHCEVLLEGRKNTGMVGLNNQGATCYLNSIIQVFYHLRAFRRAIYKASLDQRGEQEEVDDKATMQQRDVTRALGLTFYDMQTSNIACSTGTLTKAFGWDSNEVFIQEDLHELTRMLLDQVEGRLSKTPDKGMLDRLFQGTQLSYIHCKRVDYSSTRKEVYSDIQLDVKGCGTLEESFEKYTESETLEGDNQYDTDSGGFGKQDAEKGVIFESFPPILFLHLKRFEFDFVTMQKSKIHDKFTFGLTLDVRDYIRKSSLQEGVSTVYHLHSIVVHEGNIDTGHYYTYIRPKLSSYSSDPSGERHSDWFKYNDHVVSTVKESEVLENSYGISRGGEVRLSTPTAYMLVYIREADLENVLGDNPEASQVVKSDAKPSVNDGSRCKRKNKKGYNGPDPNDIPAEFANLFREMSSNKRAKVLSPSLPLTPNINPKVSINIITDEDVEKFDRINVSMQSFAHVKYSGETVYVMNTFAHLKELRHFELERKDEGK